MDEPLFLRAEDVEKLHTMSLQRFGGSAGLRDRNAFELISVAKGEMDRDGVAALLRELTA